MLFVFVDIMKHTFMRLPTFLFFAKPMNNSGLINSNFPQGFLMKSLINSDFVSIIMLTYTGLDKTYDLAHYTKRAPAFGIIRSTKIHSYTERSARSYDNPKCKK